MADVLKAVGLVGVRWRRFGSGTEIGSNREQRRVDALLQQQSERAGSNQMGFGAHQVLRLLGMPPHGFSGRRERGHAPHTSSLPLHACPGYRSKRRAGRYGRGQSITTAGPLCSTAHLPRRVPGVQHAPPLLDLPLKGPLAADLQGGGQAGWLGGLQAAGGASGRSATLCAGPAES